MSKRRSPWRDVITGRFSRVTQADIAQSLRDGSRKVYERETCDVWHVQGCYSGTWEDLTASGDRKLARDDLRAYRENAPETAYRLIKRRERIGQ